MGGVIGKDATGGRWSIGELARASGVTVRALRHYDEVGLVRASGRTGAGHRRYTAEDLRRLYRVRALRGLGLSLEEIGDALAASADGPEALRASLAGQLHRLTAQAERIQQLSERIRGMLRQLDGVSMPDPDQFMTALEMMSMLDGYFTQEQRDELARRRSELGPEAVEAAKTEWAGLVEALLGHMEAGTPVDDADVRELVRRWDTVGEPFHGGGERARAETKAAARRMWQDHREELSGRLPWPGERMAELVGYVERVREARRAGS